MAKVNFEERILGMRAVEKRFITEKQLIACVNTVEVLETGKTFCQVLLERGLLTPHQIEKLRDEMEEESGSGQKESGQKKFGEIALEQNMINQDQLDNALDEQDEYVKRGLGVQIGQILLKKGFITRAQMKRIIEGQLKKTLCCVNPKCKQYKSAVTVYFNPNEIRVCEECKWDLIEDQAKPQEPAKRQVEEKMEENDFGDSQDIDGDEDDADDEDEDDDLGRLTIIDLDS